MVHCVLPYFNEIKKLPDLWEKKSVLATTKLVRPTCKYSLVCLIVSMNMKANVFQCSALRLLLGWPQFINVCLFQHSQCLHRCLGGVYGYKLCFFARWCSYSVDILLADIFSFCFIYYIIRTGSDRPVIYRSAIANPTRPVTRPDRQPAPVDQTGFHLCCNYSVTRAHSLMTDGDVLNGGQHYS